MPKRSVDALNSSHHKTHYFASRKKRSAAGTLSCSQLPKAWPFPLENGRTGSVFRTLEDTSDTLSERTRLYYETWDAASLRIREILRTSNNVLFVHLYHFIQSSFSPVSYGASSCIKQLYKMASGFILMSSNLGSNFRVLSEFYTYLRSRDKDVKLVRLNSKENNSIKLLFRGLLSQLMEEDKDQPAVRLSDDAGEIAVEEDEEDDDNRFDKDEDDDEEAEDGRTIYDIQRLKDWYFQHPKKDVLKLVIIFEDTDSFTKQILNLFLKLIYPFTETIPTKLIFALTCSNVTSWLNTHISNEHRMLLHAFKFQTLNNKHLAYNLLQAVFLDDNSKMFVSPELISMMLHRFETSNNSIDALVNQIKVVIMIFFYLNAFAVFVSNKSTKNVSFPKMDTLGHLRSFKMYVELLVFQSSESGIREMLSNGDGFVNRFDDLLQDLQKYRSRLINFIKVLFVLQDQDKTYEQIEIYNLVVNGKLSASRFYNNLISEQNIKRQENSRAKLSNFISNDEIVERLYNSSNFGNNFRDYLDEMDKEAPLKERPFFEIFTYTGGGNYEKPSPFLLDNYECLMFDLLRAPMRRRIEQGLSSTKPYLGLFQGSHFKGMEGSTCKQEPLIVKAFNVMSEAPPSFNTYEYFIAFKLTLNREDIIDELLTNARREDASNTKLIDILEACKSDEKQWESVVYSWFLQCCSEFLMIGLIKEKPRGDHFERAIWKGL